MDGATGGDRPMGLQRERTLLAWNRTLLAVVVAVALVARTIGPPWARLLQVPAMVLAGVVVWLWVAADVRYRRPGPQGQVGGGRHLLALGVAAVAAGVGGVVAIVAG